MESSRINKEQFYDFFMNDTTIKHLIEIRDYNFDLFIGDMRKYIDDCEGFLRKVGEYDESMSEDEVISRVLELVYINLINWKTDVLQEYLQIGSTQDMIDALLFGKDRVKEKVNFLSGYQKSLSKYEDDPIEFYKNEIDHSSSVASKMVKKLSKLFSLVKESKENSIIDFEKYQKLYKKIKPSFTKKIKKYKF
jgi:polyribonucleotide nucleotidyltransferase